MTSKQYDAQIKLLNEVYKESNEKTEGVVIHLNDLKEIIKRKKRQLKN